MSAKNDQDGNKVSNDVVVPVSSSSSSRPSNNKSEFQYESSLWWPDIEDEDLKTFIASSSLQSLRFNALWEIMPSLGWKYFSSKEYKYESPPLPLQWCHHISQGKLFYKMVDFHQPSNNHERQAYILHFKDGKELQACLDHKDAYIPPPAPTPNESPAFQKQKSYEIRTRQLRDDLLKVLYIRNKRKQQISKTIVSIPNKPNDLDKNVNVNANVNNDTDIQSSNIIKPASPSKTKIHDNLIQTKKRSFTSIEKGAEVYFEKRKIQRHPDKELETVEMLSNITPQEAVVAVQQHKKNSQQYGENEIINKLHESYKSQFSQWRSLLSNHSLLFYGFGSKQRLLQEFAEEELVKDGDILTLHGYDRDFNIKQVLNLIAYHFLNGRDRDDLYKEHHSAYRYDPNETISSLSAIYPPSLASIDAKRAVAIAQRLSKRSRPIYIVLHNIDGIQLRDLETQECLSYLTAHSASSHSSSSSSSSSQLQSRSIRLVASVDHINASVALWNSKTLYNFSWVSFSNSIFLLTHNEQLSFISFLSFIFIYLFIFIFAFIFVFDFRFGELLLIIHHITMKYFTVLLIHPSKHKNIPNILQILQV